MICQICQEQNDNDDVFCRNCGNNLVQATQPTLVLNTPSNQTQVPIQNYPTNYPQTAPNSSKTLLYVLIGILSCLLLGIGIYYGLSMVKKNTPSPDHFGLFSQKDEKLTALNAKEFTNLAKGRDELKADTTLPMVESGMNFILYSDQQTIPTVDLKLIKLETIKDDGNVENWAYQIVPVDGNSEMKQLKVRPGLPKGRYALALFKGNFDEGTHKLWAFQIENGAESPSDPQTFALAVKPTPTPTPTPPPKVVTKVVTVPRSSLSAGSTGTCIQNNVVVRSSPSTSASKVGGLYKGQQVAIGQTSSNYETWRGITSNWVYVQTANGTSGWVFGHFIR